MVASAVTPQCIEDVVVLQRAKLTSSTTTFMFNLSQPLLGQLYHVVNVSGHNPKSEALHLSAFIIKNNICDQILISAFQINLSQMFETCRSRGMGVITNIFRSSHCAVKTPEVVMCGKSVSFSCYFFSTFPSKRSIVEGALVGNCLSFKQFEASPQEQHRSLKPI